MMEEWGNIYVAMALVVIGVGFTSVHAQNDFSDPIKCYYCMGRLGNSSCADPVNPREDRGRSLVVIACEHGVCIKWTHIWNNIQYMHRTCSARMDGFHIMMIDGVCKSERTGHGKLCMCGKHLCNGGQAPQLNIVAMVTALTATIYSLMKFPSLSWRL